MNRATKMSVCLALALGLTCARSAETLDGVWTLRIQDLKHREVSVATIKFSNNVADSCMAGKWRRVVVQSSTTKDKDFFPLSEPLSYALEGSEITIGRMDICDAYLHLTGKLNGAAVRGAYSSTGLGGSTVLGAFTLKRNP